MKIDEEMRNLDSAIMKMAETVRDNLGLAVGLYERYDEERAILIVDDVVDLHEKLIEQMCLSVLVRERPFAGDLRRLTGLLKLISDLERLGDHAEDLALFAKRISLLDHPRDGLLRHMSRECMDMVNKAMDAYKENDGVKAKQVIASDEIMDGRYEAALQEIIGKTDKRAYSGQYAVYATLVVKYLERIADHAVNLAEWVVYMESGVHKDKKVF